MANLPNYIPDTNPFRLAGPPDHWLRALWDFDSSLVVIPSRQGFYYRVCQRRPPSYSLRLVNEILKEDADSRMIASYNLIPVTTLLATANWMQAPMHMEMLRQRAPWRMGGAEVVNQRLEAQDQQDEFDRQAQTDEHLTYLGKDAWGLYNKKRGVQSHMYIPKTASSKVVQFKKPDTKAPAIKVGSLFLP